MLHLYLIHRLKTQSPFASFGRGKLITSNAPLRNNIRPLMTSYSCKVLIFFSITIGLCYLQLRAYQSLTVQMFKIYKVIYTVSQKKLDTPIMSHNSPQNRTVSMIFDTSNCPSTLDICCKYY